MSYTSITCEICGPLGSEGSMLAGERKAMNHVRKHGDGHRVRVKNSYLKAKSLFTPESVMPSTRGP